MSTNEYTEAVTAMINGVLRKANAKPRVRLSLVDAPNYYADVQNGRSPSGLPITGSHEMYRLADDLDRAAARLTVVFTVSGQINGVDFDKVTIWITDGRATLPTLFEGTAKARQVLYDVGADVARLVRDDRVLMDSAWIDHLNRLDVRLTERADFLAAVRVKLHESLSGALAASAGGAASQR